MDGPDAAELLEGVDVAFEERLLALGGERPVHRLARVRHIRSVNNRVFVFPPQDHPLVGVVDLGLRARGVGLRHEPRRQLLPRLDQDLRTAAGDVVPHR